MLARKTLLALGPALALLPGTVLAQTPAPVIIRIASAPDDDVTPVLWADKAGLFRQAGIEVDVARISSGTAVAAAVVGGAVDVGKSSMLAVIVAHARGVPLTVIAPGGLYTPESDDSGILVLKDSPIRSGADLDGKIISAAALNDFQWLAMNAWIDQHGGNSKRVKFIEQPSAQVASTLDAGRIDCGLIVNPAYTQAMKTGKYRNLGRQIDAISKRLMFSGWFATADFVARNPDAVRKFGEIMSRASAYVVTHHDETVPLLAAFTGIDPATIRTMSRAFYTPALDPALVQPLIDTAAKYGSIPANFAARDLFSPAAYRK